MKRPRLIIDASNLSNHPKKFQRTGIQEVVYQVTLATHAVRHEFPDLDIVLMPFLPRVAPVNGERQSIIAYSENCKEVLRATEAAAGCSRPEDLWGEGYAQTDEECFKVLAQADWVHFQGILNIDPLFRNLPLSGPKGSMTVHDLIPTLYPEYVPGAVGPWFLSHYIPSIGRWAKTVVGDSASTARDVRQHPELAPVPRVFALPLAFDPVRTDAPDPSILKKHDLIPGRFLVFVGSLEPRKNLLAVIEGLETYISQNPESDLKLVWVGSSGWKNDWILGRMANSPIQNRLIRPGYLSDEALDHLVRQAGAGIMLSHYEGFGLPVSQAFSRGVPIITTYSSSLPEACLGDAVFCDPSERKDVARAITTALEAPVHIRRRKAAETWDWKEYTRELIRIITGKTPAYCREQPQQAR